MLVLEKIEAQDYNVLRRRPSVTKAERVWLLLGTLGRLVFPRQE
jgi:phytoene/squalene synthetase